MIVRKNEKIIIVAPLLMIFRVIRITLLYVTSFIQIKKDQDSNMLF